jgi:UrcA family protein
MYRAISSLLVGALSLNSVVHAGPPSDSRQLVVHFADLDLTRIEGAIATYHRLQAAAETVCGPREDRDLVAAAAFRKCLQEAIAAAVVSVNRPTLTAYHRARSPARNTAVQIASK